MFKIESHFLVDRKKIKAFYMANYVFIKTEYISADNFEVEELSESWIKKGRIFENQNYPEKTKLEKFVVDGKVIFENGKFVD